FRSLALSTTNVADAGKLALVGIAFTLAGMVLSALAQPLFRLSRPAFAACFQCGFRFNTYVALAAASRLGGAEGVALISILIGVIMAAVPTAPSAYILAVQMKGAGSPVALLISGGTLLAAVTLPLWIAVIA